MIVPITSTKLFLITLALASISIAFGQQQPSAPPQQQQQTTIQPQARNNQAAPAAAVAANTLDGANAVNWQHDTDHAATAAAAGAGATQDKAIWPMVDVDKSNNKSTVDVHVPVFFDMTNHNDPQGGKSRLDLSVMHGLVTVSKDKQRDQDGQMTGPVKVTVFGIPVYQGKSPQAPETAGQRDLQNSVGSVRSALKSGAESTNENLMGSLSGVLNRIASFARQATGSGSGSGQ